MYITSWAAYFHETCNIGFINIKLPIIVKIGIDFPNTIPSQMCTKKFTMVDIYVTGGPTTAVFAKAR